MQQYALIVAGGNGTRMGGDLPKQFLLLAGKPVLMHTLAVFQKCKCEIVLVLPVTQISYWQQLCVTHQFTLKHTIVAGGETRFYSVKNGLETIPENTLVAIHDGVRPCITQAVIQSTFYTASEKGNAVAVVKPKDSIRVMDGEGNHSVNREYYRLIQTPQTFNTTLIKQAYTQSSQNHFTDDASVLEAAGNAINFVEGDYRNIKITTPEDMLLAEVILGGIS
jgi:2-C-methyl-D-erythritol 4-phosphate cytidylyltransferase